MRVFLPIVLPFHFLGSASAANDLLTALSAQSNLTRFTSLIGTYPSLLQAANAGNATVIAPTDEAFEDFFSSATTSTNYSSSNQLEALLSYHILQGVISRAAISTTPQFVPTLLKNSSYTNVTTGQVVTAVLNGTLAGFGSAVNRFSNIVGPNYDILYIGGIAHIADEVLTPPFNAFQTVTEAPLPYFIDLLGTRVLNNPLYSGILSNLTTEPNTTYFAANDPTLTTYAQNHPVTGQALLALLEYAIVPGQILYSPDLNNGSTISTVNGGNLTITILNGSTYVNDARITRENILVSNGCIHVIDKLLNASDPNARPSVAVPVSKSTSSSGGLSTGAKAGIGVGVTLGVLAVFGGGIFMLMKRRRESEMPEAGPDEPEPKVQSPVETLPPELESPRQTTIPAMAGSEPRHEMSDKAMEARSYAHELEAPTRNEELDGRSPEHNIDRGVENS